MSKSKDKKPVGDMKESFDVRIQCKEDFEFSKEDGSIFNFKKGKFYTVKVDLAKNLLSTNCFLRAPRFPTPIPRNHSSAKAWEEWHKQNPEHKITGNDIALQKN